MLRGVTFQRIQSRYISHPTGLAVFEEELYWANQVNYDGHFPINKILNANKFLANDSHPLEIVSKLHNEASQLHIFHAALQIQSKKVWHSPFVINIVTNVNQNHQSLLKSICIMPCELF